MFALEFVAAFVAGLSWLVFVEHRYWPTFITDIILGFLGFTIIKRINEAETWSERLAYVLSGALAYQVAMRFV